MNLNFINNFINNKKQKTMIRLKSQRTNDYVWLNAELIGHIYLSEKDCCTIVGVTSHNNGGFKVMETPEQIVKLINEQKQK